MARFNKLQGGMGANVTSATGNQNRRHRECGKNQGRDCSTGPGRSAVDSTLDSRSRILLPEPTPGGARAGYDDPHLL